MPRFHTRRSVDRISVFSDSVLVCLEPSHIRRSDCGGVEGRLSGLDSEASHQMVAASNFHVRWPERVLGAVDRQFLAWGIHLAWAAACLTTERRVLLDLVYSRNSLYGDCFDLPAPKINCLSAAGSLAGLVELSCFGHVPCGVVDRV